MFLNLSERAVLEACRSYRRSSARAPYVRYPWDIVPKDYYTPWDGRKKLRPRQQEKSISAPRGSRRWLKVA